MQLAAVKCIVWFEQDFMYLHCTGVDWYNTKNCLYPSLLIAITLSANLFNYKCFRKRDIHMWYVA